MARLLRTADLVVCCLIGIALCAAATGWLYLVSAWRLPGAKVRDALPLDELAGHSGAAFLVFVAAWGIAAVLLALLARRLGASRLSAALVLALGVGAWGYVATGISLFVVRQTPAHNGFHAAAGLKAVFLPAALAGLAGAVFGRARDTAGGPGPLVLAWLVAAVGALGLLDGILPARSHELLSHLAPARVHPLASALVAPLGAALVLIARDVARRKRRAWQAATVLLAALTALHLLHSFDYGAFLTGVVTLSLIARRRDFTAPGDPATASPLAVRAGLLLAGIYTYGMAAIWVNRMVADQRYTPWFAIRETSASIVGMEWNGSAHLTGDFGEWFGTSVFIAAVAGSAWLLREWVAPWRYRLRHEERERLMARKLVSTWGVDTLAPFVLRADKSYFFTDDERAFLAYRVVGGVAVVSGDPIGPADALAGLVSRFIGFAHGRGWRVAVLGASEERLELYRSLGLQALYHGDEAVLHVASFTLEGRAIRKVRQSGHRLTKAGYTVETLHPREIGPTLRAELEEVAAAWRGEAPERGFTMALDALFRLEDDDALFVIGRGPDGRPAGFIHFAVSHVGRALSLSTMPRLRTTPNGFNEWLVCETVAWAQANGVDRISLNFAPFAALLSPDAQLSGGQRVQRRALMAMKGHFQLDNLLLFNRKFAPHWERRYVVYERRIDLPRVGIAALAAEAYLPGLPRALSGSAHGGTDG